MDNIRRHEVFDEQFGYDLTTIVAVLL
jgi:hypothetical protein